VLNRLTDPSAGLAELARVTRSGGAVLAAVFSTTSSDPARDRIDTVTQDVGWQIPAWYTQLKTTAVPISAAPPPWPPPPGRRAVFQVVQPLTDGLSRAIMWHEHAR